MAGTLDGVRVLDLSWILSGPFCSMILADLGADVIKIEQPGTGDRARGNGPFLGENDEYSAYFMSINRGKRSLSIDLASPKGREIFIELVKTADIVLENFRPRTMEKLNLSYDILSSANPRLVYAAISGFGQTGPYSHRPALDVIVQGMAGMLSVTGEPDRGPVRPGASVGDISASLFATIGILAALNERRESGLGQYIDVGMMDCQVAIMENAFMRYHVTGEIPKRLGTRHPSSTPFQAFQTENGHVVVAIMGGSTDQWPLFCAAIDHPELIDDVRYSTGWLRTQHYDELEPIFNRAFLLRTTDDWVAELSAMGIPCGPVQDLAQVSADPQIAAREMFVELDHPKLGKWKSTGNPIKLSRTPGRLKMTAPALGEHTDSILQDLIGLNVDELKILKKNGVIS
jgi:CoA:oxalate CoA-transferase